jgi:hypothetical protein
VPSDYNYYILNTQSKYKSNVDYAAATTRIRQVVNPIVKPTNPKEFVVETKFSVIVPVLIEGSRDNYTIIFTDDTYYNSYRRNEVHAKLGELTVFYSHGATLPSIRVRNTDGRGVY